MTAPYIVHATAGGLAIILGFIALFASKGAPIHRRIGIAFTYAMLTLAITGVLIAAWLGDIGTVIGGSLATYLVSTGMITVQPNTVVWRRALIATAVIGSAVGTMALVRLVTTSPRTGSIIFLLSFASVALLAVRGDVHILRHGPYTGTKRLKRHLWRMCMALWFATSSFFLGPRRRVELILPDFLVTTPLLILPVLTVLLTMGYWIWRLRRRAQMPMRGIVITSEQRA